MLSLQNKNVPNSIILQPRNMADREVKMKRKCWMNATSESIHILSFVEKNMEIYSSGVFIKLRIQFRFMRVLLSSAEMDSISLYERQLVTLCKLSRRIYIIFSQTNSNDIKKSSFENVKITTKRVFHCFKEILQRPLRKKQIQCFFLW
jgi:hypothetical protein